ncbi:MAG: hypothetical protein QM811_20355 [Pirellulales bacterium]
MGGLIRWLVEKRTKPTEVESEGSPGVLLSSGYIAGGAIAGVLAAAFEGLLSQNQRSMFDLKNLIGDKLRADWVTFGNEIPLIPFGFLVLILLMVGLGWLLSGKIKVVEPTPAKSQPTPQKTTNPPPQNRPNDSGRK